MEAYDSLTESPDNFGILSLDFLSLQSNGFQKKLVISNTCLKCDIVELAKLKTITLNENCADPFDAFRHETNPGWAVEAHVW